MKELFSSLDLVAPLLHNVQTAIVRLPGAILTFFLAYSMLRLLQVFARLAFRRSRITKPIQEILISVLTVILWLQVFSLVFQSLGLNQIAIALSSSIAVIALGIITGANRVVADLSAGLFLARSPDFKIGRHVKIADVEGSIYSLDSRKVRVLDKKGDIVIVPNSKFDELPWIILKQEKGS